MKVLSLEDRAEKARKAQATVATGGLLVSLAFAIDTFIALTSDGVGGSLVLFGLTAAVSGFAVWKYRAQVRRFDDLIERLRGGQFYRVDFARADEAAAFVAALARQMHSPRTDMPDERDLVEVSAVTRASGVQLFLSELALEATSHAFGEPPPSTRIDARDLPISRVLLLAGVVRRPLGLDDVRTALLPG